VLFPCAEVEDDPPLIVRRAQEVGWVIAVTRSTMRPRNVAGAGSRSGGRRVLPGMEVQTVEERTFCASYVIDQVLGFQELIYASLRRCRIARRVWRAVRSR